MLNKNKEKQKRKEKRSTFIGVRPVRFKKKTAYDRKKSRERNDED